MFAFTTRGMADKLGGVHFILSHVHVDEHFQCKEGQQHLEAALREEPATHLEHVPWHHGCYTRSYLAHALSL